MASPRGCRSELDCSSSAAEFTAPAATTNLRARMISGRPSRSAAAATTRRPSAEVRSRWTTVRVSSRTVGLLQRGADRADLGVALGVSRTREAVAGPGPDACPARPDVDGHRHVHGMQSLRRHGLGERGDRRLVLQCGEREVGRSWRIRRVLAERSVHAVQALGLGVVRLHLLVADRPRRRDAVVGLQLAEVLGAEPGQAGAVDLGVAADVVVHAGPERFSGRPVVPFLRVLVPVLPEHLDRRGVGVLAGQEVAALDHEHVGAGVAQGVGEGCAAHSGTDDGDVAVDDVAIADVVAHLIEPEVRPLMK